MRIRSICATQRRGICRGISARRLSIACATRTRTCHDLVCPAFPVPLRMEPCSAVQAAQGGHPIPQVSTLAARRLRHLLKCKMRSSWNTTSTLTDDNSGELMTPERRAFVGSILLFHFLYYCWVCVLIGRILGKVWLPSVCADDEGILASSL